MEQNKKEPCPRCNGEMPSYPGALSRTDNETEICSECGREEAMGLSHEGRAERSPLLA